MLEDEIIAREQQNVYDIKKNVLDFYCKDEVNISNDFSFMFLKTLKRYFGKRIIEFNDYISNPKDSGYESLHFVIVGSNGYPIEVQARNLCQHVWSILQHKEVYKGSCNGYKDMFFQQFAYEIRNCEKQYSKKYYNSFY